MKMPKTELADNPLWERKLKRMERNALSGLRN